MPFILDNPSTDGQLSMIELHHLLEACKKVCSPNYHLDIANSALDSSHFCTLGRKLRYLYCSDFINNVADWSGGFVYSK